MISDIQDRVRRRSRRVVVMTALTAAALVLLLVGVWLWVPEAPERPAETPASEAQAFSVPKVTGTPSITSTADAQVNFTGLAWVDVRGMAMPTSASAGPTNHSNGKASGFSHTPTGALLAAAHIITRASAAASPAVFRPTITEQVVGVDAGPLMANTDADYEKLQVSASLSPGESTRSFAQLTGYRMDSYTPDVAFIRLLISGPAGNSGGTVYVDFRLEVRWKDHDWKLVAPPNGTWQSVAAQAPSVAGYDTFPPRR